MIIIDATGCGKGKSTNNKKLIKSNKSTKFLIIVPSLDLANEYDSFGTCITSETTNNVKKAISTALNRNTRVIIITQKSFIDFDNKLMLCNERIIIQDEHLEVLLRCRWQMDNHPGYVNMFKVDSAAINEHHEITLDNTLVDKYILSRDMLDNKQFVTDLRITPQRMFTKKSSLQPDSEIYRVLSPDMYRGALNIYITCANFTATRQYHLWKSLFNCKFVIKNEFVKYITPNLTIHLADQKYNSINHNKKNKSIKNAVIEYVNEHTDNPVYVDNNMYEDFDGWIRLTHNCHGVNEYKHKDHIAILSAINFDNNMISFLTNFTEMETIDVRMSLIGELAHQIIMRGVLREDNNNKCDVYLMEKDIAFELSVRIFTECNAEFIDNTSRPITDIPATSNERRKATYIRKNFPDKAHMTTRELMNEFIWICTTQRGTYTKAHKKEELAKRK